MVRIANEQRVWHLADIGSEESVAASDTQMGQFSPLVRQLLETGKADEAVLDALAALIERELRRRGMRGSPPVYFGYSDRPSWDRDGTLQLIAFDFSLWLLRRRASLGTMLDTYPSIDPLMRRNVRFFLTERQQMADPVGYATYENIRGAAKEALAEGWLSAVGTEKNPPRPEQVLIAEGQSPDLVPASGDDLGRRMSALPTWPDLLTSLSRCHVGAREQMKAMFRTLFERGVVAFRIADIVRALRDDVRAEAARAWAPEPVGFEDGDGEAVLVPISLGLEDFEDRVAVDARVEAIRRAIDALPRSDAVKRGVHDLLNEILRTVELEDVPGRRELGLRLGLKRSTLSDYYQRLREAAENSADPDETDDD